VPVVPSCLLEPAWVEFCALAGGEPLEFIPVTRWAATAAGYRDTGLIRNPLS
jgi:hypothetical protein